MKTALSLILLILFTKFSFGQETISLTGKVLDTSFAPFHGIQILVDEKEIATTDLDGKFEIQINKNTKKIVFRFLGMETLIVTLKLNCTNLEIILLEEGGCHLGSSLKKVNRIRKRRFESREKFHKAAFEKGLFSTEKFCGETHFTPYQ